MDQGTEKWLLTSRWMLWLAPAGLWGGLKLEAYLQSCQPQSFFLCAPRCSGTSDRCTGRCGVIFLRAVAAAVSSSTSLRRLRLRVAAQASRTSHCDVSAPPDVEASCITSCRGRRASLSTRRCGVTVCLQLRRSYLVLPCFFLREWFFLRVLLTLMATQLLCFPLRKC